MGGRRNAKLTIQIAMTRWKNMDIGYVVTMKESVAWHPVESTDNVK